MEIQSACLVRAKSGCKRRCTCELMLQEVVNFVGQRLSKGEAPSSVAGQLLDACLASDPSETRGIGCDNMTATIIVLHQHSLDGQ